MLRTFFRKYKIIEYDNFWIIFLMWYHRQRLFKILNVFDLS